MLRKLAAFAVIFFGTIAVANADTLLMPGGSQPPDLLFPNGPAIATVSGTVAASPITDTYTLYVFMDPSNVLCSNCLDFAYLFNNIGTSGNVSFTATNFEGYLTDVGINAGIGLNTEPTLVERSSDGSDISFVYTPALAPGQDTSMLVIETNANLFTSGGFTISDGTNTGSQGGFAPMPEPATLALFGTGLVGLVGVARRKVKI
jgi:hypothetical protein